MNAALYIRVSTDEQTEYSPAAQKNALLSYAGKNGYNVLEQHIYVDEGISGRKASSRPAFMRMIKDARSKRPFDAILVHKHDRFARSREDSVVYKSLLKRECNIKVISITEQIEDDKFSVILEAMLEAMAEYYSLNLSEEVLKGMYERAKRGGYQARAPFGYKMKDKMLNIDEFKSEAVKYIFQAYLKGADISQIAENMNNFGITTSSGQEFKKRTVRYILKNPTYAGFICFNTKKGEKIKVLGIHEKIIDPKTFDIVQDKLKKEPSIKKRATSSYKHYLSGLLYCSNCDKPLIFNNAASPFFQCKSYKNKTCPSHYITAKRIEEIILNVLKDIFKDLCPKEFNLQDALKITDESIKNFQNVLQRAKALYLNGIDSLEQYKNIKEEIIRKINTLNAGIKTPIDVDFNKVLSSGNQTLLQTIANAAIKKIIYDKENQTIEIILNTIP